MKLILDIKILWNVDFAAQTNCIIMIYISHISYIIHINDIIYIFIYILVMYLGIFWIT